MLTYSFGRVPFKTSLVLSSVDIISRYVFVQMKVGKVPLDEHTFKNVAVINDRDPELSKCK